MQQTCRVRRTTDRERKRARKQAGQRENGRERESRQGGGRVMTRESDTGDQIFFIFFISDQGRGTKRHTKGSAHGTFIIINIWTMSGVMIHDHDGARLNCRLQRIGPALWLKKFNLKRGLGGTRGEPTGIALEVPRGSSRSGSARQTARNTLCSVNVYSSYGGLRSAY